MKRDRIALLVVLGIAMAASVIAIMLRSKRPAIDEIEPYARGTENDALAPVDVAAFIRERMGKLEDPGWIDTHPFPDRPEIVLATTKQIPLNIPPGTFEQKLIHFASEYETYGLADRAFAWSPIDCPGPGNVPRLRASQSSDPETHGRKLYLVFARRLWEGHWGVRSSTYSRSPDGKAPVGQVVVKESWHPEAIPPGEKADLPDQAGTRHKGRFRPGAKGDLFIMYKLDPGTPGTDNGWVYGTATPDGKFVTSVGMVESCMRCHRKAPHDRLFGFPEERKVGQE